MSIDPNSQNVSDNDFRNPSNYLEKNLEEDHHLKKRLYNTFPLFAAVPVNKQEQKAIYNHG